jgi:hypothetical protein
VVLGNAAMKCIAKALSAFICNIPGLHPFLLATFGTI